MHCDFVEVWMKKYAHVVPLTLAFLLIVNSLAIGGGKELGYQSPQEIAAAVEKIAKDNKDLAAYQSLGRTPGGRDILMLELGKRDTTLPAVMVVANMEGDYPMATRAAMQLARLLVGDWNGALDSCRWYISPLGNPDGYANFFASPLTAKFVNAKPFNDDNDDAVDEDGPDDLNGDGYITMMRQVHPEGEWVAVEGNPVLMKRADPGKGEIGKYRTFTEGFDNDGDGRINEDGPGGVNPGHNFPHDFQQYTTTDGPWPASEPESRAILQFAFDHPEIALLLVLDRTNSLKNVPEASKKAEGAQDKYKLPEEIAKEAGIDPEAEFTMDELVEMGREFTGYQELTEEMVLQFLGVGAAVNPDREDLPYWNEINKRYTDFIKEAGLDGERLKPKDFPPGSIEEWGYFQYGVPTFSMDFWSLPKAKKEEKKTEGMLTPEAIEKMSNDEFIALGKDKIDGFLKASGAPAQYTADMVIMALQGGMLDTKKMAEMMRKMKEKEEAGGADEVEQALHTYKPEAFVSWQPYTHPTLGEVEIGGMIPYSTVALTVDTADALIDKQLPFVRNLAGLLPKIAVKKVDITKRSDNVWQVDAWVANNGFLPYPTYQGKRCLRPTPAVATIVGESLTILEGRPRTVLGLLGGSGGFEKVSWLIAADEGRTIIIKAFSFSAGQDEKRVTLKGGGQ